MISYTVVAYSVRCGWFTSTSLIVDSIKRGSGLVVLAIVLAAGLVANGCEPAPAFATRRHVQTPRHVIAAVFKDATGTADCYAYRESRFEPRATHVNKDGSVDRGLFQINSFWVGKTVSYFSSRQSVRIFVRASLLLKARYNARVAWAISKGGTDFAANWGYCS